MGLNRDAKDTKRTAMLLAEAMDLLQALFIDTSRALLGSGPPIDYDECEGRKQEALARRESARVVVNHRVVDSTPNTTESVRTLGLDPATVKALRSHKAAQAAERLAWGPEYRTTDLVFRWEDGRPLHPDLISRTFKRLAGKVGLPAITVHGLRHSYALAAPEAGVAMKVVSDRLGHSTISTTSDIYSLVRTEVDQAAADKVAALILGGEREPWYGLNLG